MTSLTSISQKEYLKKYLSGDVKKKKRKKITGANIKRSVIVDDDIDLKSMRPLEDDEVELYQMDEDAPQIAGIVDERPPEIKAQEYYSSKRWKVFGGEDGVNIIDSMNKDQHDSNRVSKTLNSLKDPDNVSDREPFNKKCKLDKEGDGLATKEKLKNNKPSHSDSKYLSDKKNIPSDSRSFKSSYPDSDNSPSRVEKNKSSRYEDDSDNSPPRVKKEKSSHYKDDSDASPPRKHTNRNVDSDSDASPPRKKYGKSRRDSDESPPRKESRKKSPNRSSRFEEIKRSKVRNRSCSGSPPSKDKTKKHRYKSDSDNSPPRRERSSHKRDRSDSDVSPPRREKHSYKQGKPDSDTSPPRRTVKQPDKSHSRRRKVHSSDSDNSPPRNERRKSPKPQSSRRRYSRSKSPPARNSLHSRKYHKEKSPKLSRSGISERNDRRQVSDSDKSPRRRRKNSEENDSDMSPPRKSSQVNDRPLKKALYKPNDVTSSDEEPNSKSKKMKKTLDGKQAGLQDAKQLKKELSDLKTKEDAMFSKMDASVSGIGAAPVKRDRKTGQIRDLEKEKEAQREKEAKESVVNEKYYKWGKGIKQTEDAAARAAEMMKEMNKPLARYVDDKDLDEFLKAQDREGDPMLEYIKRKQSESTPLQEEKPIYKGSWNPNRFNIRPGYRWDGVVRSNGYEQEWFKTKNAKKARDEEAYKWSTSDM